MTNIHFQLNQRRIVDLFSNSFATISEMPRTVMSDGMVTKLIGQTTEAEFVKCDRCGLTEECTPGYIERIRERFQGKWICGLCGEAVKDEMARSERLISTEEALARHINFCKTPPDPTVHLIATMRQILRRSLDSPTGLAQSESCIMVVAESSSDEDGKQSNKHLNHES